VSIYKYTCLLQQYLVALRCYGRALLVIVRGKHTTRFVNNNRKTMARPKKPELAASREAFKELKPLPRYYGIRVADHFPAIDVPKLQQAVAGRVEYPEGLEALKTIKRLYPSKQPQSA
jgi:hypothetical protein